MKVYLHLADGFEEIEAISVVDILRRADINVQMVSIMGRKDVIGAHNISIRADVLFEEADYSNSTMLILPGGGEGTRNMGEHIGLTMQLKQQNLERKWIAAICAAPSILGKLGFLAGKSAACYPGFEAELKGAEITTQASVVVDGHIITSRGPGTAFDFALKIVEVLKGGALANSIKEQMIIS